MSNDAGGYPMAGRPARLPPPGYPRPVTRVTAARLPGYPTPGGYPPPGYSPPGYPPPPGYGIRRHPATGTRGAIRRLAMASGGIPASPVCARYGPPPIAEP